MDEMTWEEVEEMWADYERTDLEYEPSTEID